MRGCFSIEWMAQSSQPAGMDPVSPSGPTTCGTHSESLPGFYSRLKSETLPQQEDSRSHDAFSVQHKTSQNDQVTEAGFSSGTEETSGYESEGGRSPSPSAPADGTSTPSPASPPSGRRPRTAFTAEQISSMERAFKRNAYLGTQDKAELCKKLNLSDKQIRNWFQNRRMKLKRTVQDALAHACQANVASQLMHYSELQAYRPGPYPRYHPAAAAEGPAAASYVHPHGLQYSSSLPSVASLPSVNPLPSVSSLPSVPSLPSVSSVSSVSSLPLDSFYQYSSLPGVMLPSATNQLMGSYPQYPQYY